MKIVPLAAKKKLSKFMNWFDFTSVLVLTLASMLGGIFGTIAWERYNGSGGKPEAEERIVMQQKVTHLMDDFNMAQSIDRVTKAADKGADLGVDVRRADPINAQLQKQLADEVQAVGIALAHARTLSSHERYQLYVQLKPIQPAPAYLPKAEADEDFLNMRGAQAKIMDKPGFTPTVASATAIVKGSTDYEGLRTGAHFIGPLLLTLAGMFGFYAGKQRLDKSIRTDEADEKKRIEAARKAARDAEAARKSAEEAEALRLANMPLAVAEPIDRDISVRALKLAGKRDPKAGPSA